MDFSSPTHYNSLSSNNSKIAQATRPRFLKHRSHIKAKLRSVSNPRSDTHENTKGLFRYANNETEMTHDATVKNNSYSAMGEDFGGDYLNKNLYTQEYDRRQRFLAEESYTDNFSKEKNALNSLKILSMQQEPDNPLEKEIEKIGKNVDFFNTRLLVKKKKKENKFSHTLNTFTKQDAAVQTTGPEDNPNDLESSADKQMNHTSPASFRTKSKVFLLLKQEQSDLPIQRISPSKFAHLYKLTPRVIKEKKTPEIDRRIKFFQQDSKRLESKQSEKRIPQSAKQEFGASKTRTRSTGTLPLKEQILNLQERRSTFREIEQLRIEPIKTTQENVKKVNISSSPRDKLLKKTEGSRLFPKLNVPSSNVAANPFERTISKAMFPRSLKYYEIYSKASQLLTVHSRHESLKHFQDSYPAANNSVNMLGPKIELSQHFSVHKRQQPVNLQPYTRRYL